MCAPSTDPVALRPTWKALNSQRLPTDADRLTPVGTASRRFRWVVPHYGGLRGQVAPIGLVLSYGELFGSAGLGFVWGWLLIQLTAASRPSVQRLILPLFATVVLLGTMFVLLDVGAVATCAAATGAAAVLHAALKASLRGQAESLKSFEITGGGPR